MADSISTAVSTTGGGVVLTNLQRTFYSKEVVFAAQPYTRYAQVAHEKTELSNNPGLKIAFTKYADLDGGYILQDELVEMETDNISASQVEIGVGERGKAIQVTELALQASFTDIMADAAQLLGHHLARNNDAEARDKMFTTTNILYAGGNDSRDDLTDADVMTWELIQDALEIMAVNKVPKFRGDRYIMYLTPHQAKQIRRDPRWIQAKQFGDPEGLFNGEIGRIEDVGFIITTMAPVIKTNGQIWADSANTGGTVGVYNVDVQIHRALLVGDHFLGRAVARPPELRDGGIFDLGRRHKLGYYGIWGYGLIEEMNGLIVETA